MKNYELNPSEIEENVNKIKELLKSDDFDVVNTGLELVRSLDEEALYEKLLEGCGVDKKGKLVNEKKEISDYLVCSLASISNGLKAKEILDNVTNLDLSSCKSITNVDGLANLTNLNYLNLEGCYNINVIPDGYTMKEEDNETVELDGEELKSYLQKIRDHVSSK